jgi:hypothetical protein
MPKKSQYSTPTSKGGGSYSSPKGGTYKDRPLATMSPEKAQEATKPTEAEPVRMQARMAGCS